MKICLIGFYDTGQHGLRCLEATLVEAGHDTHIIFFKDYLHTFSPPSEKEFELLAGLVRDLKPGLIGISVRSPFVWLAITVTGHLRGIAPIVWGGVHTTVAPEYSIKWPDMILRGEADFTLPLLVNKLEHNDDLSGVPGLWWHKDDILYKNEIGGPVENLDSLPFPVFRRDHRWFIEENKLLSDDPSIVRPLHFGTKTNRGCPQKCAYCANTGIIRAYAKKVKNIRFRDPCRVVEEAKRFREAFGDFEMAGFMDEVFGSNPGWVDRFCEEWKKDFGLPFASVIHPSMIREKEIVKLKDAGLTFVNMGIQSGSERVRHEIYQRYDSNENILNTARALNRNGVGYKAEFIFNNPLEKAEDLKETLHLYLDLPRPFIAGRYHLTCFPGTPITERFLKDGVITHDQVQGYTEEPSTAWAADIDLNDGHSPEYYFYFCLFFVADFRYYSHETDLELTPHRHFYPRWFVRWLERRAWLRRNPKTMFALTDKLGKFAHWSWFWTSRIPEKLASKLRTAWKMAKDGDVEKLNLGFRQLSRDIAGQLGFKSRSIASAEKPKCENS